MVAVDRWQRLHAKEQEIARVMDLLAKHRVNGIALDKCLQRPEVDWPVLVDILPPLAEVSAEVREQVLFDVKYSGYLVRQEQQVERQKRLADKRIPDNFDFATLQHLRHEAREKLSRIRPISLAQAGRISGITPADVALLLAHLEGKH